MPGYHGPPENVVYRWDTVEFEGADGRIQHGNVADVIEQRILKLHKELLVDLGDSSQSQLVVPFQKTLRFKAWTYATARYRRQTGTVQILLQTSRQKPWIWFPGKLIFSDWRSFAMVHVEEAEHHCRDIIVVPAAHVRFHHSGKASKRISRNEFVKKSVPVPEKFILDDEFRQRWKKRFPGTKPCTVSNSSLSYIQASPKSKDSKLMKITSTMIRNLIDEICAANDEAALLVPANMRAYDGQCIHHVLPKEIMTKIFRMLYTAQQAKVRSVCKTWNSWLHSSVFLKEARFDLCGENRYAKENECLRKFFAFIHGSLAPNCRRIVLTAGNGNVVRYLLRWEGSSKPCLFNRFMKIIDPEFSCSKEFPTWHTNYPQWGTRYTLTRGGARWSFELIVVRIFSYHGSNEESLKPTIFPDHFKKKPGLPKALKLFTTLGQRGEEIYRSAFSVCLCMSNPTGFVFTTEEHHVQTWDFLNRGNSDSLIPSHKVRCLEGGDYLLQLKMAPDGKALFAAAHKAVAVLDISEGVPQVKTVLQNPDGHCSFGDNYTCLRGPMVVSDDGNLCFVSCNQGYIHVWDVRTGQVATRFHTQHKSDYDYSQRIDRSSDGLTLWTAGQDMKVRSWDIRTFGQLCELDVTGLRIHDIKCCPGNKDWIAVTTDKKFSYIDTFVEWRRGVISPRQESLVVEIRNTTRTEEYLLEVLDHESRGLLKYSPNGDWLIALTDAELCLLHHPHGYLAYQHHQMNSGINQINCDISAGGQFVAISTDEAVAVYEVVY